MHAWGWTALVVLVVGVAGAGYWWWRFPGAARHAFHPEHTSDRRTLTSARRDLRAQERRVRQGLAHWHSRVEAAQQEQQKRISAARTALDEARDPGPGRRLAALDPVVLHERAITIGGRDSLVDEVRSARAVRHPDHTELVVEFTFGPRRQNYRLRPARVGQPGVAEEEAAPVRPYREVRAFADRIENAAEIEHRRQVALPKLLKALKRELAEAQSDTVGIEAAQSERDEAVAQAKKDPELLRAGEELAGARRSWQDLTGRRPPK